MTFLLLVDDSSESMKAEKILREKGVRFLRVRPAGLSVKSSLPMLMHGRKKYVGTEEIQKFVKYYAPKTEHEKIRLTLRALEALGIKPNMSAFNDRLRLQKIVYLLQQFGLQTHWGFNWYVRGPYSPELAHEAFERGGLDFHGVELTERDKHAINVFREKMDAREISPIELETAAAILFIRKHTSDPKTMTESELVAQVLEEKPHLAPNVVKKWARILCPDLKD